tara:strand:- start:216 stop:1823 length:1608 start_codon:yes stop_codon:yes gene_type:complete
MANPKARREDETFKEWMARLARERLAEKRPDVTQPAVAPLVDIEPTVSEQVEQTVSEQPALQSRGLSEVIANPNRPLAVSGGFADVNTGLPGDNYGNLLDQIGPGGIQYSDGVWPGYAGRSGANDAYNIIRKGVEDKGYRIPGMLDNEGEEDVPWMKGLASGILGFPADVMQEWFNLDSPASGRNVIGAIQEGWTGKDIGEDWGKFDRPIRGGSKWFREAFGQGEQGQTEYENFFDKATTKQTGWPWGESKAPEEVELKLSLEGSQIAGLPSKDGTKGDVPAKRTQTPSVMGNSKSRMMMMMLGENPLESMDMAKVFEKAESDFNTAILIGGLNGKGVGPAQKFMSSFLQGAGLQYRMDNDKKNMAYNIMTTRASPYYWHDANDGIEPLMLFPWDPIPKGYVSNKPELTGQQRDRKQYREILDEFPNDREAGLDAVMDAYIANNPQIFSIFEGFEGSPQEIMESKYEHAARWATGMFNSGGGEHYTRQERQEFAAEWAKAEESDDWQWIIKTILRKQRGWPAAYDDRVRARFGEK